MPATMLGSLIPPDLRFAAAPALASPGERRLSLGDGVLIWARSDLALPDSSPAHLRYADRSATLIVEPAQPQVELFERLGSSLHGENEEQTDRVLAICAMDLLDEVFREADLWAGNIYLAGYPSLGSLIRTLSWPCADSDRLRSVLWELAALELVYHFPVAAKFRQGGYDGDAQFRLNGWGRSLARRFPWPMTPAMRSRAKALLARDVDVHHHAYERHLESLGLHQQHFRQDRFLAALRLPIPVLV